MEILQYPIPVPSFPVLILQIAIWFIRVWKGIFGIRDLTKIPCGNRENHKYLDGIWDLTAPQEAGLAKIWAWEAGFFRLFVGNPGNCHHPNKRSSGPKPLVSPFKPNYWNCQRVFCFNQMPEKSTWSNSIPVIHSTLNWLSVSSSSVPSKVYIYCSLERIFFHNLSARCGLNTNS